MIMKNTEFRTRTFDVSIPNLEGDGVAETVPIEVRVYTDSATGEEVLTPESLEMIEKTKARRMGLLSPKQVRALRKRLHLTQEAQTPTSVAASEASVSKS